MTQAADGTTVRAAKRIVICLDGTWNKVANPDQVTNVVKFAQAVRPRDERGVPQLTYYNSGVGSGGPFDRFVGGVFGFGIRANVHRAYSFLILNYEPGDEIYIVGFSRGAYTARALAALISAVGVLKQHEFERFEEAWAFYRLPRSERERVRGQVEQEGDKAPKNLSSEPERKTAEVYLNHEDWFFKATVKAIGVWDTVGSYGIPSGLMLSGLGNSFAARTLGFHDRQLGRRVEHAFHAIGLDEARGPFQPTFWTGSPEDDARCEQAWFPGVHSDVGGGYSRTGLSDLALLWILDRMRLGGEGLAFDKDFVRSVVRPCPACELHRSDNLLYRLFKPSQRRVFKDRPALLGNDRREEYVVNERLHWSVVERRSAATLYGGGAWSPETLRRHEAAGSEGATRITQVGDFEREILGMSANWDKTHPGCWGEKMPDRFAAPSHGTP